MNRRVVPGRTVNGVSGLAAGGVRSVPGRTGRAEAFFEAQRLHRLRIERVLQAQRARKFRAGE
jgi:hypothetical protein